MLLIEAQKNFVLLGIFWPEKNLVFVQVSIFTELKKIEGESAAYCGFTLPIEALKTLIL